MAMLLLNANQIINIASEYRSFYNLKEEEENEIKKILVERGHKKFYIFRYIAIVKNFLILSRNLKFTIEIPMNRERLYLHELNRACFLKIIKREKKNNEFFAIIDVYY